MELTWLEDCVALAATGNFSRAAEARGITQPAFSRRVRTLEDWVGVALFVRSPHGVAPSAAGEVFLSGADELIRTMRQLRQDAREAGGRETATLRFAATHALSFTFFPHWMRRIEAGAQSGPVRLISDNMQACEELMLHGQVQFLLCHHHALAPGRCAPEQFRSVPVGMDVLVPYVAPDAAGRPRWRLDAMAGELPLLSYTAESGLARILQAHRFGDRFAGPQARLLRASRRHPSWHGLRGAGDRLASRDAGGARPGTGPDRPRRRDRMGRTRGDPRLPRGRPAESRCRDILAPAEGSVRRCAIGIADGLILQP
jgi:DNA-binding transcriptional LysR family regulator